MFKAMTKEEWEAHLEATRKMLRESEEKSEKRQVNQWWEQEGKKYLKTFLLYPRKGHWTMLANPRQTIRQMQAIQEGFEYIMEVASYSDLPLGFLPGRRCPPIITLLDLRRRPKWAYSLLIKAYLYGIREATLTEMEKQGKFDFSKLEEKLSKACFFTLDKCRTFSILRVGYYFQYTRLHSEDLYKNE